MGGVKKVTLSIRGIRELLKSQSVVADVAKRVHRAARSAGDGFEGRVQMVKANTARGVVRTADSDGRKREAEDKVLIRTLDAMR